MVKQRLDRIATQRKTRPKSFRIDEHACTLLEQPAKDRNLNTSDVINDLLLHELGEEEILKSRKTIRVNLLTLKLITEALSEKKIIEIGEKLANDALLIGLPFEIAGETSPTSIQQTMKFLARHWSFEYSEVEHEGKKVVILAHYVGRNYSLLLGTYWKAFLSSVGTSVNLSIDNDAVLLRF